MLETKILKNDVFSAISSLIFGRLMDLTECLQLSLRFVLEAGTLPGQTLPFFLSTSTFSSYRNYAYFQRVSKKGDRSKPFN